VSYACKRIRVLVRLTREPSILTLKSHANLGLHHDTADEVENGKIVGLNPGKRFLCGLNTSVGALTPSLSTRTEATNYFGNGNPRAHQPARNTYSDTMVYKEQ
jgi:hypothetical protein